MADKIAVYKAKNDEYSWHRVSENGQVVEVPGETFTRESDAERSAKALHPDLEIVFENPAEITEEQPDPPEATA